MITSISFLNYNQMDNIRLVVDSLSETVLFSESKALNENERAFITIYSDGFAEFGITYKSDPLHNNQPYTWSSNAEYINTLFNLLGTPFELAKYSCVVNGYHRELTLSLALKIANDNQHKLHYDITQFYNIYKCQLSEF